MDISNILLLLRSKSSIKPRVKNIGIVYDMDGVELDTDTLAELEDRGMLTVSGYEYYPACNICKSTSLTTLILCNSCKSNMLERYDLVIHYDCSYTAPIHEFIVKEGTYTCPRCSKSFNRIGIDYGRPGDGYRCLKCNAITQYPLLNIVCSNGHTLNPYDLDVVKVKSYILSDEAKRFIGIYEHLIKVVDRLVEKGINAEMLVKVKGISGVEHTVALYINTGRDLILVDYVINPRSSMEWFSAVTKIIDIPNTLSVLVTDKVTESSISSLLKRYGIRLIVIDELDYAIDTLVREVVSIACKV